MKKTILATLLCLSAANVNATLMTYDNRGLFEAANTGLANEDFEDVTSIAQVLASTNIEAGLTLSLTSGTDAYLAAPGQSSNPSQAIGVNIPRTAGWAMDFSTDVNAVGFDVFQNDGGGDQFGFDIFATVEVFGASGLINSYSATIGSGTGAFIGVVSDSDFITRVTVNEINSYDVIDNVSFGKGKAPIDVPEPMNIALFGMSLLGLALSRKKKLN